MKHCVIMTAYKNVDLINCFIGKIPIEWGIYIHLDKKSSISINEINPRAKVIKKHKVYWGAWEHLYAFWTLLNYAIKDEAGYDYFHLVTGQDFLATSPENFDNMLGYEGFSYIEIHPLPRKGWWEGGFQIFEYYTLASFCDIRGDFSRWLNIKCTQLQKLFRYKRTLPKVPLFSGIVYSSLHKDFVSWMLNDKWSKELLLSLRNTTLAEEVFFHTVIMNSPYRNKVVNKSFRYFLWPGPKILQIEDFDDVMKSQSLFCRKIDSKDVIEFFYNKY